MFKPIKTLSIRTFKQNKGRNLVAIFAIILTTLMFTTLFVLSQSISKNIIEMAFRQTGYNAQVSIDSITTKQAKLLSTHPDVAEIGNSIVLGLAENKRLSGHQVEIRWADKSYATHTFSLPTTGSMPIKENEIALDSIVLHKLGIKPQLGQKITLEWRKDINDETLDKNRIKSTFILCGYWEGNESSYASMAWVSKKYTDNMIGKGVSESPNQILGMHMAQISLHSDKNIEGTIKGILKDTGLTKLKYGINLAYSKEMTEQAFQESIPMYLGMFLVFIAGYLIIYNIFQISVTTDIQFYGKLKTLGTTNRQLKKLIYSEANLLCIIGIPIGMIFGYLLGMVLVPALVSWNDGQITVSASPIIFIGSSLFAWMTVIISCLRPARMAGKVSPMEALRYNETSIKTSKNTKKAKKGISLLSMAKSNLGRNKKRTITVIFSLTFGLVLLSCFYAKNAAFDMEKYLEELVISDFDLEDSTSMDMQGYNPKSKSLSNEFVNNITSLKGIESIGMQYSHDTEINLNQQTVKNLKDYYTEDKLKKWESYDANGVKGVEEAISKKKSSAIIFGVNGIPLDIITKKQYILDGSFEQEKFNTGDYIIALGPAGEKKKGDKSVLPTYSVGDKITIENKTFTVMTVVSPLYPITRGAAEKNKAYSFNLDFILPSETFRKLWPENNLRKLYINVEDSSIDTVQNLLDEYMSTLEITLTVTSRKTMEEQYKREIRSSSVMGNAISIVIAMVGILNYINSMVTAIVSRKREFAMIQSIGMTRKQLNKMLIFEGLSYASLTLIASYVISAIAVGFGVRLMVDGGYTTFRFTLMPLVACTPLLLLLAVLIPFMCFKNLEKHSIVERLKMDI